MASLLLSLSGGDDVSSSDFYLEYLCTSSFRLFHEPLRRSPAPPNPGGGLPATGPGRPSATTADRAPPSSTTSGPNRAPTAAAPAGHRKSNGQCGYQQRKSQTSRIANDHAALL